MVKNQPRDSKGRFIKVEKGLDEHETVQRKRPKEKVASKKGTILRDANGRFSKKENAVSAEKQQGQEIEKVKKPSSISRWGKVSASQKSAQAYTYIFRVYAIRNGRHDSWFISIQSRKDYLNGYDIEQITDYARWKYRNKTGSDIEILRLVLVAKISNLTNQRVD